MRVERPLGGDGPPCRGGAVVTSLPPRRAELVPTARSWMPGGGQQLPGRLGKRFLLPAQVCVTRVGGSFPAPRDAPPASHGGGKGRPRGLLSVASHSCPSGGLVSCPPVARTHSLSWGRRTPRWSSPGPCVSDTRQAGEEESALASQGLLLTRGRASPEYQLCLLRPPEAALRSRDGVTGASGARAPC